MTPEPPMISGISEHARGSALSLSIVPRASSNELTLESDGTLRIRVTAPPVDGAANKALLRFLADVLGVPPSRLAIVTGESSRRKRIAIDGLIPNCVEDRLRRALAAGR